MKKLKHFNQFALGINIAIILLESVGMVMRLIIMSAPGFEFYTVDSNLLSLLAASVFVYYTLKGKTLPRWARVIKLTSVAALALTFLVVITILAPIYPGGFPVIMFSGQMLYFHTICPILAFISFIFFEKHKYKFADAAYSMIYTLIYAAILIMLNIMRVVVGPYPFLMVYNQPVWASIAWGVGILGFTFAMTLGLLKLRRHK